MKKSLFKVGLLTLIATCCTINSYAQSSYGIKVADITVSSSNKDDVLSDGKVKYDPDSHTLTLNGATVAENKESTNGISIDKSNNVYTIQLVGSNTLYGGSNSCSISTNSPLKITGSGTLNITNPNDCGFGINMNGNNLTISDCTLNVTGEYGIYGRGNNAAMKDLTIDKANVTSEGGSFGYAVCYFNSLSLNGVEIITPKGAAFNNTNKCISLNGLLCQKVVIGDPTGISTVKNDIDNATEKEYYGIDGRKNDALKNGVNIIRMSNGKVVKRLVKQSK